MTLSQLPPDIWIRINKYLKAESILLLRNTGCQPLRLALEYGIIRLSFCTARKVPPSIIHTILAFKRLQCIEIPRIASELGAASHDWHWERIAQSLPNSMLRLKLPFHDFDESMLLTLPKSITSLSITYSSPSPTSFEALPEALLELENFGDIVPPAIQHLPTHLQTLRLSSLNLFDSQLSLLPRSLTVLSLGSTFSITDDGIGFLPPNLTELRLNRAQNLTSISVFRLPRTLTYLHLPSPLITGEATPGLPPGLLEFVSGVPFKNSISDEHVIHLPRMIKPFAVRSYRLTEKSIGDWPEQFFTDGNFFPEHLRPAIIPRYLIMKRDTKLVLPNWAVSSFQTRHVKFIWRKVSFAEFRNPWLEPFAADLPPHLTSLCLPCLLNLSDSEIGLLPQTLTSLIAPASASISDEGLAKLPPLLTVLNFAATPHLTDVGINLLPRTLTYLILTSTTSITNDGLAKLPRSVRTLDLSWVRHFTDDSIPLLPPYLTELRLTSSALLTDACIKYLPRSLKSIDLSRAVLLTSSSASDFPNHARVQLPYGRKLFEDWHNAKQTTAGVSK